MKEKKTFTLFSVVYIKEEVHCSAFDVKSEADQSPSGVTYDYAAINNRKEMQFNGSNNSTDELVVKEESLHDFKVSNFWILIFFSTSVR